MLINLALHFSKVLIELNILVKFEWKLAAHLDTSNRNNLNRIFKTNEFTILEFEST